MCSGKSFCLPVASREGHSMKAMFLNPFLSNINNVVTMVVGVGLDVHKTSVVTSPIVSKGITVSIGVTGGLAGNVIVNIQHSVFFNIVNRMTGMVFTACDELSKSAIGELFNMSLGGVSAEYEGLGVKTNITPPIITDGKNTVISIQGAPMICVAMHNPNENIFFDVCISLRETKHN